MPRDQAPAHGLSPQYRGAGTAHGHTARRGNERSPRQQQAEMRQMGLPRQLRTPRGASASPPPRDSCSSWTAARAISAGIQAGSARVQVAR